MTKKKRIWVLCRVVLVLGTTVIGCDTGNDDNGGGNGLLVINEPSVGLSTITYTNVKVHGEGASGITVPEQSDNGMGVTAFSIDAGKLSLTLETPTSTTPIATSLSEGILGTLFFDTDGDKAVIVGQGEGPVDVAALVKFDTTVDGKTYALSRFWGDANNGKRIVYVYVSSDVTLSRGTKIFTNEAEEPSITIYYGFELSLKTGWNLVQFDVNETPTRGTIAVKIADKNIPWILEEQEEGETLD